MSNVGHSTYGDCNNAKLSSDKGECLVDVVDIRENEIVMSIFHTTRLCEFSSALNCVQRIPEALRSSTSHGSR